MNEKPSMFDIASIKRHTATIAQSQPSVINQYQTKSILARKTALACSNTRVLSTKRRNALPLRTTSEVRRRNLFFSTYPS